MLQLQRALGLETNNLPDDQTLINVLNEELNDFINIINAGDPAKLDSLNDEYSTGFYKALCEYSDLNFKAYAEEGYTVEMKLKGTLSTTVGEKTNLFAEVNQQNAVIDVTIKDGSTIIDQFEEDTSGLYLLKRMPDDAWKIFY
ncbi:hypothetical protein [Bacillus taeanensis]|nr:hypothetical protein [Bacillus taeanensis]